jgi:hypothetical protein
MNAYTPQPKLNSIFCVICHLIDVHNHNEKGRSDHLTVLIHYVSLHIGLPKLWS